MTRALVLLLPLVAACSSAPDITSRLTPYRIDVRQGNYVTQEMVAQLKPGLSKDQVRFILGTPLVTDLFHADRWDYVYRFQPGHGEGQQRRLIVYFAEGKLARVSGDVVTETQSATEPQPAAASARVIDIPGEPSAGAKQDAKPNEQQDAAPASGR